MMKIIEINIDDVLVDESACSEMISQACTRSAPLRVTGLVDNGTMLFVLLEERPPALPREKYRLAPLCGFNRNEVAAALNERYCAGFSTIGSFVAGEQLWGLFARIDTDGELVR